MRQSNNLKDKDSFSTKKTLNNSQKLLAGTLALILVAGMASPAFALTIDTFDEPTFELTADDGSEHATPTDSTTNLGIDLIALGDSRFTAVTWQSGSNDVMAQANSDGILAFSSDFGTTGLFDLTYDANGAGLGGIDLTENGGSEIVVDLVGADASSDVTVTVMDTGVGSSTKTIMTAGGPEVLHFDFGTFSGDADFELVDKIQVSLQGVSDGDYAIDLIGIPQKKVGGTVGSMSTVSLLVAGAEANMGLWSLALVGAVAIGAAVTYKVKSNKTEQ